MRKHTLTRRESRSPRRRRNGGGDRMFKTWRQGAIVHTPICFGRVHHTAHRSKEDSDYSENLGLCVQVLVGVRALRSAQSCWEPHCVKRGEGSENTPEEVKTRTEGPLGNEFTGVFLLPQTSVLPICSTVRESVFLFFPLLTFKSDSSKVTTPT